jgi:UDP:flavonoid glycosyltransferase YjiC (YdhE family)
MGINLSRLLFAAIPVPGPQTRCCYPLTEQLTGVKNVQHALSCGVPVVVAGLSEDKPRVGHRVEWSGVGINLRTATPTKEQVQNAVREILQNPSYRERAQAVQKAILQVDTIGMIADHVDTEIRTAEESKLAFTNKIS